MHKTPLRVRIGMLMFAFVLLFAFGLNVRSNVAWAVSRVTLYYQQNIPSQWWNLEERYQRVGQGTFWWNAFGSSSSFAGAFDNLSISPVTGLYVAVGPTNSSFAGTLYELVVDDASAWGGYPQGVGSSALPADSTKIVGQGTLQTNTANIGPLTAGSSSGQSVIDLVECALTPSTDQTSSTINIVNSSGGSGGTGTVNRDRVDAVGCTFKASASSSSPSVPTVDTGYVSIGYVTVPYNTSVITGGMVTASTSWSGFVNSNGGTCIGCTLSGTTTNSGTISGGTISSATISGGSLSGSIGGSPTLTGSPTLNGGATIGNSSQLTVGSGSSIYSGYASGYYVPFYGTGGSTWKFYPGVTNCTTNSGGSCTSTVSTLPFGSTSTYNCVSAGSGGVISQNSSSGSTIVFSVVNGGNGLPIGISYLCWGS